MIAGFIIWSVVSAVFLGLGIWAWKSDQPVGFYAGVKPPEVIDTRKYNHAVAVLWFAYAGLLELLGVPLLFLKQNSAGFILPILGVAILTIALAVAYSRILAKYRRNPGA